MTQIGKSNVKWSEIRDALNKNGGSVSNKAEDAFKVSSKYQKWARWKPTKYNIDFHPNASFNNDEMWHAAENHYFGIKLPKLYNTSEIDDTIINYDDLWIIDPPIGKIKNDDGSFICLEPFRLGDFAGHDIESRHPIKEYYGPESMKYISGAEQNQVFVCRFNNNIGTDYLDITDFGVGASENLSNSDNFQAYYFGAIFINTNNKWTFIHTRNHQIGDTSSNSEDNKPSIYEPTNNITPSYDSFIDSGNIMLGDYKVYFAIFKDKVNKKGNNINVANGFYMLPCKSLKFNLFTIAGNIWTENISISKNGSNGYNVSFTIKNETGIEVKLYNTYNYFQVGAKKYQSDVDFYMSAKYPDNEVVIPSEGSKDVTVWLSNIAGYTNPMIGDTIEVSVILQIDGVNKGQGATVQLQ